MTVPAKEWGKFIEQLSRISGQAVTDLLRFVNVNGGLKVIPRQTLIDYAYLVATKYGEASSALAAAWYDALAEATGKYVQAAEVAPTATYAEAARTVNGVLKQSMNEEVLGGAMERMVKLPGVDTTVRNAIRDGAEVAWIPMGDTCAFCLTLASRGWQRASKKLVQNGHAEHVHANCDCTYAVRFDENTQVAGYNPQRYRQMYDDADGRTPDEKINALRRQFYAENREEIRAQQNSAYEKRVELNSSAAEETDV